jgi:hypothetical protein
MQFVMVPALVGMQFEAQKPFLVALAERYGKMIGAVAGITILFGIGRGIAAGVLGSLGTPYERRSWPRLSEPLSSASSVRALSGPPRRRWPRRQRARKWFALRPRSEATGGMTPGECL